MKDYIASIIKNNDVFVAQKDVTYFESHLSAQHPKITMITCCDSRCHPHVIETDPINKIFTVETIGNQMKSAQGSVDYGVLHLRTPILLILGHTDCGAIKAFMNGYECENEAIKSELDNLTECLDSKDEFAAYENELLNNIQKNIDHQVELAVLRYQDIIASGELMVVGAIYDFQNVLGNDHGRVTMVNINGEKDPLKIKFLAEGALDKAAVGRISY